MDELAKQDHTYRAKARQFDFDKVFELQSQSKTVSIENQVKKLQNQYFHNNAGDGILLQAILAGTGTLPKAGGAHDKFFDEDEVTQILSFLLQTASFTVDGDPL